MAGEPLRLTGRPRPADGPRSSRPSRWRRPSRAPRTWTLFATQLGRLGGTIYQLGRSGGDDRGPADGADEPAQPACAASWSRGWIDGGGRRRPATIAAEPVLPRLLRADPGRTRSPAADAARPARCRSSWRSCAGAPTRSRRPWRSASPRSTPITRTSSNTPRPSRRSARRRVRGDLPGDPAHREAGRGQPLRLPGQARGRRHPGAQRRRACGFARSDGIPFVADFSLNAANPLTVELLEEPRGRPRDGLVRPERRPALATCSTRRLRRGSRS